MMNKLRGVLNEMNNERIEFFKPFLNWAIENKHESIYAEILKNVEHGNITGIWGYLLQFFDSVGICLTTDVAWFNENDRFCLYHFWIEYENGDGYYESDLENMCNTRAEAQQEAVKKAFEILEQ